VSVGIAKVDTGSAEPPIDPAFYYHTLVGERLLPLLQLSAIERKHKVY